jgi:hypothetical protein
MSDLTINVALLAKSIVGMLSVARNEYR